VKTTRTYRGPFAERPFFSSREIETICNDALREVDLFPIHPEAVRIDRFIEKKFKITLCYEQLPEGVLGLTRFSRKGVESIVVSILLDGPSDKVTERRLRSTLAHEAGHGLMHTYLFATSSENNGLFGDFSEPASPKVLCRDKAYKGQWWEYQANQAIGALLMPYSLVNIALEPFMLKSSLGCQQFDFSREEKAVLELTKIFDVNGAVARIRISELLRSDSGGQLML